MSNWKDTAEVVGIAAIVASLVFVGLEMRQSREIALAEIYQARTDVSTGIEIQASANPEFTAAMAKIMSGRTEEVTGEERVALEWYFGASMQNLENQHFQYVSGFLPEEHWQKNVADIHCFASLPAFRVLMEGWTWRKSFQEVVDQQFDRADRDPSNTCWQTPKPLKN